MVFVTFEISKEYAINEVDRSFSDHEFIDFLHIGIRQIESMISRLDNLDNNDELLFVLKKIHSFLIGSQKIIDNYDSDDELLSILIKYWEKTKVSLI